MSIKRFNIYYFLIKKLFILAIVVASCQQKSKIDFPLAQLESPQPKRFNVQPRIDSLKSALSTYSIPVTTIVPFKSDSKSKFTKAHSNRHKIPKDLTEITVHSDSVIDLPFTPSTSERDSNYSVSDSGDTLLLGRLLKMEERLMDVGLGNTNTATKPRFMDLAKGNIQYLDIDQGMESSYIFSMLEDQHGSLWMGSGLGVSKYNGVNFTHYTMNEGFSFIWSILEDRNGCIWFGTWGDGIIKYDGLKFTRYLHNEEAKNVIYDIEEDKNGNLWMGTDDGLIKYDGKQFYFYGADEGFLNVVVNDIFEDSHDQLWVGTEDGVIKFDGHDFFQYTKKSGLSHNSVLSIYEDKTGYLWFGTKWGGVNKFNGKSFVHYTTAEGLSNNSVRVILEDNAGNIWFNTDGGGANQFNGNSFTHYGKREGLYVDIYASIKDSSGNIWFGTNGGGVSKFSPNSFNHFSETDGLVNNYVYSIMEDKNSNLWFGTDSGINKFDGQNHIGFMREDIAVDVLYEDTKRNIWFGTNEKGLFMFDGTSMLHFENIEDFGTEQILSIMADKNDNVWFGTNGGGALKFDGTSFTQFTKKSGLCNNKVNVILKDTQGNMWFGTDGGLSKYDGYKFTNYTADLGFLLGDVASITEDKSGNIWMGSRGNGVSMYDGSSFMHFTKREGLLSNIAMGILADYRGHIWVTTEKGLNQIIPIAHKNYDHNQVVDSIQYKIITYETGDGLKAHDFFQRSISLDRKNQLWLGGGKCLSMIDLNAHELSSDVPRVFMRRVDINGEMIDFQKSTINFDHGIEYNGVKLFDNLPLNLRLPHNRNHITLNYSAIDWKAPHDLHYSYILDGLNDSWSPVTNDTKVDYRNVPPGEYIFRVRARGKSQKWSEEASINFVVSPPWYQTAWARGLFIALGLALVVFIFLLRERYTRMARDKLEQMVDEKTEQLQIEKNEVTNQLAQKEILMQEVHHRVKNNLTFLKSLLYLRANATDDQDVKIILDECQSRIHAMAMVHQNLYDVDDSSKVDFNLFLKELFFELENMFDKSQSEISVDVNAKDLKIDMRLSVFLGLILNELITNTYKYAFVDSPTGNINILLLDNGNEFSLNYSDSGKGLPDGFQPETSTGFGFKLINILLNQLNAKMSYKNQELSTFNILIPK